jgi:hypothetical protein
MRSYREKQKLISEGKANCKTNSKSNVSSVDKNRKEKNRVEEEKNTKKKADDLIIGFNGVGGS